MAIGVSLNKRKPASPDDPPIGAYVDGTPASSTAPLTGEEVHKKLVRSSVLIKWTRGELQASGSGFVVDRERRWIVTNNHVVRNESVVHVVFPKYDSDGNVLMDANAYTDGDMVSAEVVDRDASCDLALIRVERLSATTTAVSLAAKPAAAGAIVYSVGNSGLNEQKILWRLTKGNVRARAHQKVPLESGNFNAMTLETDAPVNRGDSGGAVVSERGEVVAVVSYGDLKQRAISGNVDVEEVRKFLAPHLAKR